jgi:ectoine hydroxylase-related dioxygenase (phytanoyl-CoA dioxygenase family)
MPQALSAQQVKQYQADGYLSPMPVFDSAEIRRIDSEFQRLIQLLPEGRRPGDISQWHEHDAFLYDICAEPRLLDLVECLIGPDFYLWGSHFFAKPPHDPTPVAWHQDAYYWPLEPREAASVWLAFSDSDVENGCMRVIPRTHRSGILKHQRTQDVQANSLWLELEGGQFNINDAVDIELKAGQASLHDDHIVHGSDGNSSSRWRVGLAIRYSPNHVKCDLDHWPRFLTFPMRGNPQLNKNPIGSQPNGPLKKYIAPQPMSTQEARDRLMEKRAMAFSK